MLVIVEIHRFHSQVILLTAFLPGILHSAFGYYESSSLGESVQLCFTLFPLRPMSDVYGLFWEATKCKSNRLCYSGSLLDSSKQPQGSFPCLALGFLFDSLWLLREALPNIFALIHHSLLSTNLPFHSELARNSMVLPSFFSVLSSIFFSQLHPHWLSQFSPAPVTYYDLSRASQHSLFLLFGFLWLLQVIQTYIKSTVLQPQHHLLQVRLSSDQQFPLVTLQLILSNVN